MNGTVTLLFPAKHAGNGHRSPFNNRVDLSHHALREKNPSTKNINAELAYLTKESILQEWLLKLKLCTVLHLNIDGAPKLKTK